MLDKIKNVFKSRLLQFLCVAAVSGIIGNRSDDAFLTTIWPWVGGVTACYNWILSLFLIETVLFPFSLRMLFSANNEKVILTKEKEELSNKLSEVTVEYKVLKQNIETGAGNCPVLASSDIFYPELTRLVTTAAVKSDLYVSIGEGDFVNGWLIRIFEDSNAGRGPRPKIQRVIVKMLSHDICNFLEEKAWLASDFESRMNKNIEDLCRVMAKEGVSVVKSYWNILPPFHGFLYKDRFFVNSWIVDGDGRLHVRTSLFNRSTETDPEKYEAIMGYFNE